MSEFITILTQLHLFSSMIIVVGIVITGSIILIYDADRLLITALVGQYILLGYLVAQIFSMDVGLFKAMIGAMGCLILFFSSRPVSLVVIETQTVRQKVSSRLRALFEPSATQTNPDGGSFRFTLAALSFLLALSLAELVALSGLSIEMAFMVCWLKLIGIFTLILTTKPLKAGAGLLTFISGFDLYYGAIQGDLLMVGLWGIMTLFVALAVSYLMTVRAVGSGNAGW